MSTPSFVDKKVRGKKKEEMNFKKQTILVTGGAGFIGSNFIRYILKKYQDYKIINLDKLTYAGNLKSLFQSAKFIKEKKL